MYEPWPKRDYPSNWRIVLAFFITPGAAACLMALVAPAYDGLPTAFERFTATAKIYAVVGAYPIAVFLGIPAYFMLRPHFGPRPLPCAVAGAVVACILWIFLMLFSAGAVSSASIDGQATIIDGSYTAFGWLENLKFIGQIALVGCVAGLVFWCVAAAGFNRSAARAG